MKVTTEYFNTYDKNGLSKKWWLCNDDEIYTSVFAAVQNIDTFQSYRRALNARHMQLYGNMEALGIYTTMYDRSAVSNFLNSRLSLNVVKACCDTITSKIVKQKPRPLFMTEDGNFEQQEKAKQLTKYIDGLFDEMRIYFAGAKSFLDSTVFDLGVLKFYTQDNQVKCERVLPFELLVDYNDGLYADPRQIHQMKFVDRDILIDMFPDHEAKIRSASSFRGADAYNSVADEVRVVESWHLPSAKGASDGKHVIAIDSCTLLAEEYKKDYFPFTFLRWNSRLTGFYGMSLAEELYGLQIEINKILRTIQLGQHLACVPRVFIENSSQVNSAHINNDVGSVVKYTGTAPVIATANAFPPEMYNYLDYLYRKAFEVTGISLLSATSQKPAGLNAAVALREYQDIETERFMAAAQRYEQFYIDAAKICVDLTKDLYKSNKNLSVKAPNKKFIETINWKDVDMKEDEYVLRIFPTSILPTTPAAKLQKIQEMVQAGWIDKDRAMLLLDFPDEEAFVSQNTSSVEVVNMLINQMISKGEYMPPEPYMNISAAKSMVQGAYLKAKTQQVPEDRLELLRRFMDDCDTLVQMAQKAQMEAMQVAQMQAGVPTGVPAQPQVAELLPNVPQGAGPIQA